MDGEKDEDWHCKTEVKENAGRRALWEGIQDVELPVTKDVLKFKRISVRVMDKNSMRGDVLMSTGDFALRRLGNKPEEDVPITVRLKDKRGKSAGRLVVSARVTPMQAPAATPEELMQMLGSLQLKKCKVSQLKNTAMFGKQDLYVKLTAADWSTTTKGKIAELAAAVHHAELPNSSIGLFTRYV